MTLGVSIDHLHDSRAQGRAILAAVAYDIVGLESIVAAGEKTGRPIIAQVGSSAFRKVDRGALIAAARSLAAAATVPVGLHLDHSTDLDEIRGCLDAGYSSVMFDGSRLPLPENIALTRAVVDLAQPYGAWVEAELGHIAGDEDRTVGHDGGAMTEPDEAAVFVTATGVDALAVCIGNVHGRTAQPPVLDIDRLRSIAGSTDAALVLHGASSLDPDTLASAVSSGVVKINVNADLRSAYLAAAAAHRQADATEDDLVGSLSAARSAVTEQLVRMCSLL